MQVLVTLSIKEQICHVFSRILKFYIKKTETDFIPRIANKVINDD